MIYKTTGEVISTKNDKIFNYCFEIIEVESEGLEIFWKNKKKTDDILMFNYEGINLHIAGLYIDLIDLLKSGKSITISGTEGNVLNSDILEVRLNRAYAIETEF